MSDKLVIVPCGKSKIWDDGITKGPIRARDAYTGTMFKLGVRYAEAFNADWIILSAKYGYILPDQEIEAYDVTFKKKSSNPISDKELYAQLCDFNLLDYKEIVGLGGADYRKVIHDSFFVNSERLSFPFAGLTMGNYMHALIEAIQTEICDAMARSYEVTESKPLEIDDNGKLTFLRSYWKLPTIEGAFSGWFEGKPTKDDEKWEYFKIKAKRETWLDLGPHPEAWDQLIETTSLIGKKVLIQMWDPWMFLDEDEAPHPLEAIFTGITLIHNEEGFLQCYMCLSGITCPQSVNDWDGSPRVKQLRDGKSLLSLGELYQLSVIND